MKNLGGKAILRTARTALAYSIVNNRPLTHPASTPFLNARDVSDLTKSFPSNLCGATGSGTVNDDMVRWNWIRHGVPHDQFEYTQMFNHLTVHPQLTRLTALMIQNTGKWTSRESQRLVSLNNVIANIQGVDITSAQVYDIRDGTTEAVAHVKAVLGNSQRYEDYRRGIAPTKMHHGPVISAQVPPDPISVNVTSGTDYQDPSNSVEVDVTAADVIFGNPLNPTLQETTMSQANNGLEGVDNLNDVLNTLNQVPQVVAERDKLKGELTQANATIEALRRDKDDTMQIVNQKNDEITKLGDDLAKTRTDLLNANANGGGSTINKLAFDDHTLSEQANDLDHIAQICNLTREELDMQMSAFKQSCAIHLPNAVAWQPWCDPSEPLSKAPFAMRSGRAIVASGPSGTGKTFLLEALCHELKGARCLITYNEAMTYAKLFAKERVASGRTFWQLGPIPMAKLCGIDIVHDEFDHALLDAQSQTHGTLDRNGSVHLSDLGLVIHPANDCVDVFTCNSLTDGDGEYHGEVGTALKTRFAAVFVDYPDEEAEAKTIEVASGADAAICTNISTVFKALRNAERDHKLTGPFSVRESCAMGKLVKDVMDLGGSQDQAMQMGYQMYVIDKRPRDEQIVAAETIQQAGGVEAGPSVDADDLVNDLLGR